MFFNHFAGSGVWCTITFWLKNQSKNELEYQHRVWFDFGRFLNHFWSQNRYKIDPETVLEGPWMRISFRSSTKKKRGPSRELWGSTNKRISQLLGEGNREGANGFTRLTSLGQAKGSADSLANRCNKKWTRSGFKLASKRWLMLPPRITMHANP